MPDVPAIQPMPMPSFSAPLAGTGGTNFGDVLTGIGLGLSKGLADLPQYQAQQLDLQDRRRKSAFDRLQFLTPMLSANSALAQNPQFMQNYNAAIQEAGFQGVSPQDIGNFWSNQNARQLVGQNWDKWSGWTTEQRRAFLQTQGVDPDDPTLQAAMGLPTTHQLSSGAQTQIFRELGDPKVSPATKLFYLGLLHEQGLVPGDMGFDVNQLSAQVEADIAYRGAQAGWTREKINTEQARARELIAKGQFEEARAIAYPAESAAKIDEATARAQRDRAAADYDRARIPLVNAQIQGIQAHIQQQWYALATRNANDLRRSRDTLIGDRVKLQQQLAKLQAEDPIYLAYSANPGDAKLQQAWADRQGIYKPIQEQISQLDTLIEQSNQVLSGAQQSGQPGTGGPGVNIYVTPGGVTGGPGGGTPPPADKTSYDPRSGSVTITQNGATRVLTQDQVRGQIVDIHKKNPDVPDDELAKQLSEAYNIPLDRAKLVVSHALHPQQPGTGDPKDTGGSSQGQPPTQGILAGGIVPQVRAMRQQGKSRDDAARWLLSRGVPALQVREILREAGF